MGLSYWHSGGSSFKIHLKAMLVKHGCIYSFRLCFDRAFKGYPEFFDPRL